MSIEYRGERFSGYNKPKRSIKGGKKSVVLAKEGKTIKMIRFGDANMKIKKNIPARKKSCRTRHGCDKGKLSKLTARYWSCKAW